MKKILAALTALFASVAFGATSIPVPLLSGAGSSVGQTIVSTGATTAPGWASVPLSGLASIAANTVLANGTGASAPPAAFAMPGCSLATNALQWTSNTGFTCNSAINAATLGGTTFASPGSIGSTTAGSGAFTTLSASSTVSGSGFSTYLASPPAIGGTAAAAGSFTTLSASSTVSGSGFSTYLASPPAIGGTAAAAGSFTTLSASSTVSGSGFSTYLASPPSIGGTTPAAGKFTTLQATGLITPTSTIGIAGTATNDNAQAGSVGEFPNNATTATSLTTATNANATSTPLTAGDWDVECTATFNPAGSTTVTSLQVGISTTSATFSAANTGATTVMTLPFTTGVTQIIPSPLYRVQLASSGTAYCVVQASFGTSTMTVNGFIRARRPR